MRPEFQSIQPSEASKKRHDPSSQLFENWNRQTRRGDESAGVRRGSQRQREVGTRAGSLGVSVGKAGKGEAGAETQRWAGKGPEAAGNSQPRARRPSVGSPKATSEVLPPAQPQATSPSPHTGTGEKMGEDARCEKMKHLDMTRSSGEGGGSPLQQPKPQGGGRGHHALVSLFPLAQLFL